MIRNKKFFKTKIMLLALLLILPLSLVLSSCDFVFGETAIVFKTGGVRVDKIITQQGEEIQLPEAPTREGYDFAGWYFDDKYTQPCGESFVVEYKGTTYIYAKWDIYTYAVTLIDYKGNQTTVQVDYGLSPEFVSSATELGYSTRWLDENGNVVDASNVHITGEAVFREELYTRTYTLYYRSNIDNSVIKSISYKYLENTQSVYPVGEEFEFDGYILTKWYFMYSGSEVIINDGDYLSAQMIEVASKSDTLIVYGNYELIKKSITYQNTKNVQNPNQVEYDITSGKIILQDLECNGYDFKGWYSNDKQVTEIDSTTLVDYVLYAVWDVKTYTITYILGGGVVPTSNPTTYTIESAQITLVNPTKSVNGSNCEFLGWTGTGLQDLTLQVTIPAGSYGDREYIANYAGLATIVFVVDGKNVKTISDAEVGKSLDFEKCFIPSEIGMSGYSVANWYIDSSMNTLYNNSSVVTQNLTLYGSFEYITNNILFYDYLEKFDDAVAQNNKLVLSSHEEALAYFDYVRFFNVTKDIRLELSYITGSGNALYQALTDEATALYNELVADGKPYFQNGSEFTRGASVSGSDGYIKMYASDSYWNNQATKVLDAEKEQTYSQQDYALRLTYTKQRNDSFDDFKINNVQKTINVTKSDQLVWVLENGYKPNCKNNSMADIVYKKAKNVLRNICDDSMTDVEKMRAIYEWLVLNVEYDNKAYQISGSGLSANEIKEYNSWFAEGVFNNGVAVCEGFSKSLIIMARIEGIPAIYVTGNGHAWNKVYIDGNWYAVDATHGNMQYSEDSTEVLSYAQFLMTDAYKTSRGYTASEYTSFKATTVFDYYDYVTFVSGLFDFDLVIENEVDMQQLFKYVEKFDAVIDSDTITFEFEVESTNLTSVSAWIQTALLVTKYNSYSSSTYTNSTGKTVYCIFVDN